MLKHISEQNLDWPIIQHVIHVQSYVCSAAFSPDGKHIVSGSYDKTLQLWDAKTGEILQPPLEGHEGGVLSVAFSPDGKHIVSGSDDMTVRLWDAETGKMLQPPLQGHESGVLSVAFSPDGKHIMSGSKDKTILLWDAKTGEILKPPLEGHEDGVLSVAFSPDGKHIVSGSSDKTIRLWDPEAALKQPSFEGHKDSAQSVVFSPDGKPTMSGSVLESQHSICFSPHPDHALIDVTEIFHDTTALSSHKLVDMVKMNSSGWLSIGPKNKLLLWIPPIYHPFWYSPGTHMIIPVSHSLLDLSNIAHGSSWELCYSKKT